MPFYYCWSRVKRKCHFGRKTLIHVLLCGFLHCHAANSHAWCGVWVTTESLGAKHVSWPMRECRYKIAPAFLSALFPWSFLSFRSEIVKQEGAQLRAIATCHAETSRSCDAWSSAVLRELVTFAFPRGRQHSRVLACYFGSTIRLGCVSVDNLRGNGSSRGRSSM